MSTLLTILIDGLIYGAWRFLVAAGLTLIFGVMKVLSIAHGNLYAIGAYVAATAMGYWFADRPPSFAALAIQLGTAVVAGVVMELLLERGVLRDAEHEPTAALQVVQTLPRERTNSSLAPSA